MLWTEFSVILWPAVYLTQHLAEYCIDACHVFLSPDAGYELSMLISGEYVGQDRGQPLDPLLGCVLLQHAE